MIIFLSVGGVFHCSFLSVYSAFSSYCPYNLFVNPFYTSILLATALYIPRRKK
nr:MAG TPA: hypothetical protein [Caudoviricetes sp.]